MTTVNRTRSDAGPGEQCQTYIFNKILFENIFIKIIKIKKALDFEELFSAKTFSKKSQAKFL
ncbi:hypothetical protein LH61_03910 [Leuconostoc mesenteroides P45]|nr:hypothetical protein LH61_03910 [Leuconostoc mesenteroides P45]